MRRWTVDLPEGGEGGAVIVTAAIERARNGFYGWRVVALMLGPRSAGNGVYVFGNTLFVIPLEESLGLGRSVSSVMFAVGGVVAGLSAPISGMFMDRWGPRRVLVWSVLIGAAGYGAFAGAPTAAAAFLIFVGPISLVMLNVAFNASSGIINNWFERYKSTAFALMQGGSGLGSLGIIAGLAFAIDAWGWRPAAVAAAVVVLALGLPTALATRNTPEEMGLEPDGAVRDRRATGLAGASSGPASGRALRTRSFWMMAAAAALFGSALSTMGIHFVPVMVWKGLTEVQGALMLTVWALGSVATIVVVGTLADRLGRFGVGSAACLFVGTGVLLTAVGGTGPTLWLAVVLLSGSSSLYPLVWSILGELFGRRSYSTIRGYMMAAQAAGTLGVPIMAGTVFEATGSYAVPLFILAGLWAGAALLLWLTPRRSYVRGVST